MTTTPGKERLRNEDRGDVLARSVDQLIDAVAHEEPVMAVLGADEGAVLAIVNECVRSLLGQPIRIVRIRGSQDAPLTLPRIVQELGAGERGRLPADDDELIVRMLAKPGYKQGRVVLIVERAEFLPQRTLAFLQAISTVFSATEPKIQIIFAGHPRFKHLVEADELAEIHGRIGTVIEVTNASKSMAAGTPTPHRSGIRNLQNGALAMWITAHRRKIIASLLVTVAVGVTITAFQQNMKTSTDKNYNAVAAVQPQPQSSDSQPFPLPVPPPQAAAPERPGLSAPSQAGNHDLDSITTARPTIQRVWPTGEQLVRLRGEFEHFLAQTEWGSKRQSDSERSRLFNEFLQWNYGALSSGSELSPGVASLQLSRARVTLHFLAGSVSGKAMAHRFATALRSSVALTRTRSVADVPQTYELRYFAEEDESMAEALAQVLHAPDVMWTVRIMPDSRPAPMSHTVECWIPLR